MKTIRCFIIAAIIGSICGMTVRSFFVKQPEIEPPVTDTLEKEVIEGLLAYIMDSNEPPLVLDGCAESPDYTFESGTFDDLLDAIEP